MRLAYHYFVGRKVGIYWGNNNILTMLQNNVMQHVDKSGCFEMYIIGKIVVTI